MVGGRNDVGEATGLNTGVPGGPAMVARRRRRREESDILEPEDMVREDDNGDSIVNGIVGGDVVAAWQNGQ